VYSFEELTFLKDKYIKKVAADESSLLALSIEGVLYSLGGKESNSPQNKMITLFHNSI